MTPVAPNPELVIGVSPLGLPDPRPVAEVRRAGGLGVLDLGAGDRRAREALARVRHWTAGAFAVRVGPYCALTPEEVAEECGGALPPIVLLAADADWKIGQLADECRVLAEVGDRDEARRAAADGAYGLVARGSECGGRGGDLGTFVLLQALLADPAYDLPVWACGGIGPRTAAAAVAGGAAGVVLDTQLALLAESGIDDEAAAVLRTADGSGTSVVDGVRVLRNVRTGLELPLGQDGFLAARFADRWGTVAAAVRGVREAILAAVGDPAVARTLAAGSAMADALGTRLPVVQGPMTRVSDRAGFAAAVAREGALPMLALALSDGDQSRALLERTRDELAGRPWGVGILGFADSRIRAEQLAAVRAVRPTHAIIAGGRPSQAADLEAVGVKTFLHVPSATLLEQFIDMGMRKFVFEGAECGGHVGPRNSFPLWEAQLAVVEEYVARAPGTAGDFQVLLAGGIHDERSSAMAAALTAPLAARGVAVGVLMGTAYLFTAEAVEHGAIQPVFQRQVIAAGATALLESAPGHATRCVASPYTADYAAARARLRADGTPDRQAWEELERLNIGRLRIASKGVEREGPELRPVSEQRQLDAGMFMAGEVAVLRSAATTVGALHDAVSRGATAFAERRSAELREALGVSEEVVEEPAAQPLDIAVVGMACMFPKAPDLATYWANVIGGVDAVTEVPADRWDPEIYHDPTGERAGTTASRWGGFLPPIPFDPFAYGIPPASLGSIEPVQLLALEAARRALEDAGYGERPFDRSRTSVVFGAESGSDLSGATTLRMVLPAYLGEIPAAVEEQLPTLTEDSFPGMLANVIAGRIANRLDLGGANYTVDAACASSLAALDVACKELASGTSEMVLCGGADLHNGINDYLLFSSVRALSPTGRSRTFDASADGTVLGEGVACVALKRLADAERDGDRVYAVVKGIGSASDGRSLGLTAPRPEGQRAALERAYRAAGIPPARVGLVEAHGTGTVVGDRTELATLTAVFTESGAAPGGCALGSVKSQLGHTKCAAGLAGLIKAAMALHTGITPPTLHLQEPNAAWDPATSPFAFHAEARPWAAPPAERVAGVSAFGFGGTNFHAVLTAHATDAPPAQGYEEWPAELFLFRGADTAAAGREAQWLLGELGGPGAGLRLRDAALVAARRAETRPGPVRIAVVAESVDELPGLLRKAAAGERGQGVYLADGSEPGAGSPGTGGPGSEGFGADAKVAFLFPGQGSQRPGMLAELLVAFPEAAQLLRQGGSYAHALYPPKAFDPGAADRQQETLKDTRMAQPALGIAGVTVSHILEWAGVRPDMAGGHSYGELVALAAAGALTPDALLDLSARRAESILDSLGEDPGTMAAVAAAPADVERVLADAGLTGRVVAANRNGPRQTIVSGPTALVDEALDHLRGAGHAVRRIPVACAFHSPLVAGAGERFAPALARHPVRAPEFPVWSNRTAAVYPARPEGVRAELAAQIGSPVRFAEQVEAMYAARARIFVEAGPGTVLTGLVGQILGDRPHLALACEPRPGAGLRGLLESLARLAVAGVPVRAGRLLQGRGAVTVRPEPPGWTVDGHLVRTRSGDLLPGALQPARRVSLETNTVTRDSPSQHDLIADFLRTTRELVAAQRDVLLTHLGATGGAASPPPVPPRTESVSVVQAPVASEEAPQPVVVDIEQAVLTVISERTGYPVDMIEPDLDLEADLSIDSIKRTEIVGELARHLAGTRTFDDAEMEELSRARTVAAITAWITGHETQAGPESGPAIAAPEPEPVRGVAPRRFLLEETPLDVPATPPDADLHGRRFALLGGGATAEELAARLRERGAQAVAYDTDRRLDPADGPLDGVFHLGAMAPSSGGEALLPGAFEVFRAALRLGPRWLICGRTAPGAAEDAGAGLHGLFRTIGREYGDIAARVVDLDPAATAARRADFLLAELYAEDRAPVVVRTDAGRYGYELVERALGGLARTGAGPAGDGAAEAAALGLDRDSVVVLAGGARGITADVALALAAASHCRIELLGRTPLPTGPEDPELAGAADAAALRALLAARGDLAPAAIEREVRNVLAGREVTHTLDRLERLGSPAAYRVADMCDGGAVAQAVKEIQAEHGRIDVVVYAAGVIEDRLIEEKDPESFRRVYATKADGARALLDAASQLPHGPGTAVLFGSVSAVLGNRGQSDYAAANDALAQLGERWARRTGRRALTVHWGPWAPSAVHGGMVTPHLAREYARRGVALIDREEGALALLRELAWGDASTTSVVYTASGW
ncbi:type I polyketide synthase [Streptomyces sp. TLI_146]|uniref:type I polyketide synthase n=1 Tax=Streptomyces sp. TLI_146 TaxID=1938858 RepID=UPI000C70F0F1|nr:type I polyketide synthase [Streptomyces sp. TLI_146]PKV88929.1 acyl transferase domain-containing protein [Streptomyces sp. TLI_146]